LWGKNRIINELKFRNISSRIIEIALKELPETTYLSNFHSLAEKNWENSTERKGQKKNKKFVDFLLRKGYETHLIYDKLKELDNNP
jgi:regulatory protein